MKNGCSEALLDMEAKEITLSTYSSSLQEISNWGGIWGRGGEISFEAPVTSVTAWPQLYPSAGCHCAGGAAVWPSGSVALCARAGRGKLPGLLHRGCQLPFHKHWRNHLLSTPVFIYMSRWSLAIRFWVSAKDEFSVGDCECINTLYTI